MAPIRRDFGERDQDEPTLMQPRMWQDEGRSLNQLAAVIEKIEVDNACRIRFRADAPKLPLDRL